MKHMVIRFLFFALLLTSVASALDFSFDSPESVGVDEEFIVSILSLEEVSEEYDVKIFVFEAKQAVSEIYFENDWKSPYYYLNGVFPSEDEFKMMAHVAGEGLICVRLRKTASGSSAGEVCNDIVVESVDDVEDVQEENEEDAELEKEDDLVEEREELEDEFFELSSEEAVDERIVLNSPVDSVSVGGAVFRTKQEKTRLGLIYGFSVFCVVVIILLGLRKL